MLHEDWLSIALLSFAFVSVINALLASCTTLFYRKKACGQMTHSQLRIKQGNANFEHRLNVFGLALIFNCLSFRIYFIALLIWATINLGYLLVVAPA